MDEEIHLLSSFKAACVTVSKKRTFVPNLHEGVNTDANADNRVTTIVTLHYSLNSQAGISSGAMTQIE